MNTTQNAQGTPGPDSPTKLDAYLNRAADALLEGAEKLADVFDDVGKSVAQRLSKKRELGGETGCPSGRR